jgi:hypothetical protein
MTVRLVPAMATEWLLTQDIIMLLSIPTLLIVPVVITYVYPRIRIWLGAAMLGLSILLLLMPSMGWMLGVVSLIDGFFLLGLGLASGRQEETGTRAKQPIGRCPRCSESLSSFPSEIKFCPYCANPIEQ